MAEILRSVDIDFTISDKTAAGMCRLLSDYLDNHPDKTIETVCLEGTYIGGEHFRRREVRLVGKEF